MSTTVLMLGHKSQVGKDTLAEQLDGFTRVAFADRIKTLAQEMFFLTHEQVHGSEKNIATANGMTPRQMLVKIGNDMRAIDKDVWCNYVFKTEIPRLEKLGVRNFVITDFRFKNEYHRAFDWKISRGNVNLITVKIERPDHNIDFAGKNDISEIDLDDFYMWDYVIQNDGNKQDLKTKFLDAIDIQEKLIPSALRNF